jgi:hypothetical protein
LVSASRRNKLFKVRDGEAPSPTRETRALPGVCRYEFAFHRDPGSEQCTQALCHRPDLSMANGAIVHSNYSRQLTHRAGAEHLVGAVNVVEREIGFPGRNIFRRANFEDCRARNSFRAGNNARRSQLVTADREFPAAAGAFCS